MRTSASSRSHSRDCAFRAAGAGWNCSPRRWRDMSSSTSAPTSATAGFAASISFPRGGRWMKLSTAPLAGHDSLNVRTYVRHGGVRGIYFLAEWIPNRLAVLIGPRMYGLPYRLGRLRYQNDWRMKAMRGEVTAAG